MKKAINNSKEISLERFIFSIGIRHIGQENAKILANFFFSIDEFSKLFEINERKKLLGGLVELDGIGETQTEAINNFFSNTKNIKITKNLIQRLKIKNYSIKVKRWQIFK